MELERQLSAEIQMINRTLSAFGIDAGTRAGWTTVAGNSFILYGLRTGHGQTIDAIERRLPELSERLSALRQVATTVRLRRLPLALEVVHPAPSPLSWQAAKMKAPAWSMLVGRVYGADGAHDDVLRLSSSPHVLIVGMSGSGKSTLARMMLLSLAINTPPEDCEMVVIDMKNSDLAALRTLPHVSRFAFEEQDASAALRYVHGILRQRIERQVSEPKLLLAIDEMREAARLPGALDLLGSIVSLGRSLGVHVLAATQHPKASEIGSIVKANFAVRLVGQVVGARHAEAAADRPGTGAELLPGNGAFLRIDGAQITRVQAYWLDDAATAGLVRMVGDMYGTRRATPALLPVVEGQSAVVEGQRGAVEAGEDEIDRIAEVIRRLWEEGASKSAMCREALSKPYAGSYAAKIDRAIARLEASTTTTPPERLRSFEREKAEESSSSSRVLAEPAKILRLEARA